MMDGVIVLEDEEAHASVKREKGAQFLSSHPAPQRRAQYLAELANQLNATDQVTPEADVFVDVLQSSYEQLMDEQVKFGDHGRLQHILMRHKAMGIAPTDVAFYEGESWRMRGGAGDHEKAMAAYRESIKAGQDSQVNHRAYRELGYLEYKHGDQEQAKTLFRTFLQYRPEASDREMIEFYLEDGW